MAKSSYPVELLIISSSFPVAATTTHVSNRPDPWSPPDTYSDVKTDIKITIIINYINMVPLVRKLFKSNEICQISLTSKG